MASISAYDSNSISTLFSSLNRNNKTNSMFGGSTPNLGVDLSTYSMIKKGSYYQMMKAYYSEDSNGDSIAKNISTSTSKDDSKTLVGIEGAAEDLTKSAEALYKSNSDAFKKKDGEYDKDAIYKAVDSFVDDYNALVKATGKSNTSSIANAAAAMVNYASNNANSLSKIGISYNAKDYTLSIDEDKFKNADMSTVKSMFSGNGSFAYSVAVKASMIDSYASIESSKSNTYGNSGNYTYNYKTGELYNTQT